ncbi:MAG: AbrB/MazE/SpoVT family DNA-binding domain-containing protein [Rhodospirillales bacterium]|nr:AbrB/MazE/SpoVT family DNA-binding domain-containing protein [Rhodospirillales bacterium]
MSLVRVRRAAQITLPRDVRKKLDVREDDFFDVQIVEDGVLLKPVSFVDRDVDKTQDHDKSTRAKGESPREPSDEDHD